MTEREKLIELIEQNEDIQRYKKIEKLINENKELKRKLSELKSIQKQLVNAKHIEKTAAIKSFESRYEVLLDEIENYPLMSDYLALQSDINEMLQAVADIIEEGIEADMKDESLF